MSEYEASYNPLTEATSFASIAARPNADGGCSTLCIKLSIPLLNSPIRSCRTKNTEVLEGSDKLARDAFVHSGKVFTSLVLFNASIISHNSGAPTDITVGAP